MIPLVGVSKARTVSKRPERGTCLLGHTSSAPPACCDAARARRLPAGTRPERGDRTFGFVFAHMRTLDFVAEIAAARHKFGGSHVMGESRQLPRASTFPQIVGGDAEGLHMGTLDFVAQAGSIWREFGVSHVEQVLNPTPPAADGQNAGRARNRAARGSNSQDYKTFGGRNACPNRQETASHALAKRVTSRPQVDI